MMLRAAAMIVALPLLACAPDPDPAGTSGAEVFAHETQCPASDEAFVERALLLIHGRHVHGARERAVLVETLHAFEAAYPEAPRRTFASALAKHPDAHARSRELLGTVLGVPRIGPTANEPCFESMGPASVDARLAVHARDHGFDTPYPTAFSLADLTASALHLDDLRPVLVAHVYAPHARPFDAANVSSEDLEMARRVHLRRGFERDILGSPAECGACHEGPSGVTNDVDPRFDRYWPVHPDVGALIPPGLEDEVFRVHGVADGPIAPWGSPQCGTLARGSAEAPGILELADAVRIGLESLTSTGVPDDLAVIDRNTALALAATQHVVDEVWQEASGHALTLPHGAARNGWQWRERRRLLRAFVDTRFSLSELYAAVLTSPYLDEDPRACGELSIPPVFDPFGTADRIDNVVHPLPPHTRLRATLHAMGWPMPPRTQMTRRDALVSASLELGLRMREAQPGHDGTDAVAELAFEAHFGNGTPPEWLDELDPGTPGDMIVSAIAHARESGATVEDLVAAIFDRVLIGTPLPPSAAPWLGVALSDPVDRLDDPEGFEDRLRALVGSALQSPAFVLAGGEGRPATPPALELPGEDRASRCRAWAPTFEPWLEGPLPCRLR